MKIKFIASILMISFCLASCNKPAEKVDLQNFNLDPLSQGFVKTNSKASSEAIQDTDSLIKENPTNPELYMNRGKARLETKDSIGALQDFEKARDLYKASKNQIGFEMASQLAEGLNKQKQVQKQKRKK